MGWQVRAGRCGCGRQDSHACGVIPSPKITLCLEESFPLGFSIHLTETWCADLGKEAQLSGRNKKIPGKIAVSSEPGCHRKYGGFSLYAEVRLGH